MISPDKAKKTKTPLVQLSADKQRAWMSKQLETIALSNTKASSKGQEASKLFKTLIQRLAQEFPSIAWKTPSGEEWKGSALPISILGAFHPKDKLGHPFGNLMHMGAMLVGNQERAVRWLLASGCDAAVFDQRAGRTAIGYLALAGKHKGLRACREAGLDLTLFLRRDQMTASKGVDEDLVDSTLLHRVAHRCMRYQSEEIAAAVIQELLLAGLDPLQPTATGKTARDFASGKSADCIEQWVAGKQAERLAADTPAVSIEATRSLRL